MHTSLEELYGEIPDKTATPHSNLVAYQLARYHMKEQEHPQLWPYHACDLKKMDPIDFSQVKITSHERIYKVAKQNILGVKWGCIR